MVVYLAANRGCQGYDGHLYRRLRSTPCQRSPYPLEGLLRLSGVMAITVGLIIAEPDLGATVVIVMMMVGVFFLAGAPPTQFLIMLGAIVTGIVF